MVFKLVLEAADRGLLLDAVGLAEGRAGELGTGEIIRGLVVFITTQSSA